MLTLTYRDGTVIQRIHEGIIATEDDLQRLVNVLRHALAESSENQPALVEVWQALPKRKRRVHETQKDGKTLQAKKAV